MWTGKDEDQWMGWLDVIPQMRMQTSSLKAMAEDVRNAGFTDVLLLGMGGSSLCPEVMRQTFGVIDGYPELHVLDSTVPAQVRAFEERVNLAETLCVVASKSGGTTEPNVFRNYFFNKIQQLVGEDRVGQHFIAITDPGSIVEIDAKERGFRYILPGIPSIGGRFSALSNFGMAPAALMGVDIDTLLERAERMAQGCAAYVTPGQNPGMMLGITLGELVKAQRNKVTFVTSPGIGNLGAWLEQLLAESTGKSGKGLIPIEGEPPGPPQVYGMDRVFIYIRLDTAPDPGQDEAINALETAGHPTIRITVADPLDIGVEFFRWEFATAVAGSVLNINPFNQPNVQESKDYTKNLTDEYEKSGSLPSETPILEMDGIRVFTDKANAPALAKGLAVGTLEACLRAHLSRLKLEDYVAINAYIEMNAENREHLQAIRQRIRDHRKVATTVGYGPRFLHSTGQLHKGGPDSGLFLQITSDDPCDLDIPGRNFTFGVLKRAQSTGDFLALSRRERRLLRLHLTADVPEGLARIRTAVEKIMR